MDHIIQSSAVSACYQAIGCLLGRKKAFARNACPSAFTSLGVKINVTPPQAPWRTGSSCATSFGMCICVPEKASSHLMPPSSGTRCI